MQLTSFFSRTLVFVALAAPVLAQISGYVAPPRVSIRQRRSSQAESSCKSACAAHLKLNEAVTGPALNTTSSEDVQLVSFKGHDELSSLLIGNRQFALNIEKSDPGLLRKLTDDGQSPPFMFIGCSDSRVSENQIFNAKPGTLFTQRNIANQFTRSDTNVNSVLAYAVAELKVRHVIVMGHYGCGGVAASIASPPHGTVVDVASGIVQDWIQPIRNIFQTSTRQEIIELRNRIGGRSDVEEPEFEDPGFMALVEENVKTGVRTIAESTIVKNSYQLLADAKVGKKAERSEGGEPQEVFIHGWVYNIATGIVKDLGVTISPPGVQFEAAPASAVEAARKRAHAEHAR